jgi:hypothetical protein
LFGRRFEGLEGEVIGAEPLDVLELLVELVEMPLLVAHQGFKKLLGNRIGVLASLNGGLIEQQGQRSKPLVVQAEMPVHVLVHHMQFVGHAFVQQLDARFLGHKLHYSLRSLMTYRLLEPVQASLRQPADSRFRQLGETDN